MSDGTSGTTGKPGTAQSVTAKQISAGRTRFLQRRAKFLSERDAPAEADGEARKRIEEWDTLIDAYMALLRRAAFGEPEQDAIYKQRRQQLLAFARRLRETPSVTALLYEAVADVKFGLPERPTLCRLLKARFPEQTLAAMLDAIEHGVSVGRETGAGPAGERPRRQ